MREVFAERAKPNVNTLIAVLPQFCQVFFLVGKVKLIIGT